MAVQTLSRIMTNRLEPERDKSKSLERFLMIRRETGDNSKLGI